MKKLLFFFFAFILFLPVWAQDEELALLKCNSALYTSLKNDHTKHSHRYLIDKGIIIVSTDTLNLPFADDFSRNNNGSLDWNKEHITDTFYNVFGTCLATEGVPLTEGYFMNSTAWTYSYDTINKKVDSVATAPLSFTFFGPASSNCFSQPPSPFTYWNTYYLFTFDTLTGRAVDSVLVRPTDTIYFAPVIYFAQGETGKLWTDNYAYVNNTYPVNPPTIGVATLDGLNEYGLPYNNSSSNTYGRADYLTSKPINLSTFAESDSLYLSFFVEAQGIGDYPDLEDSLVLEFKDNSGEWRMLWYDTGYVSLASVPNTFSQFLIKVPTLAFPYTYFYSTFQFRFRNDASLYGNNDHWHIDYVKLDKNRSAVDTIIYDIAFQYSFPTILKNYTLMPADQFNFPVDLRDSIVFPIHNLDPNANNNPPATNFVKGASEVYPSSVVIAPNMLAAFNAVDYDFTNRVYPAAEYSIPNTPNWPVDSLITSSHVFIEPNDSRAANDTLYHTQKFDYSLAYDDGTAERAYGITGLGLKKFAYEFDLNQPDTLTAFQIQYSQVEEDVSNLVFNFYAWDSLKMNDFVFNDTIGQLFSINNKKPYYIDSLNGFTTYKLDTPIIISGKIYFGWAQTDTRRLQVGYDLNSTLGRKHMFIFSNSTWKPSTISTDGSPMIRLIFDSNFWGGTSSIKDLSEEANKISVYPNPTSGYINIKSEKSGCLFQVDIMNMIGETVKQESNVRDLLSITDLSAGIYLLSLREVGSGIVYRTKIIKTSF